MSFVSQAFDEVRASLLQASTCSGSSRPSTRADGDCGAANGAGDPHSRDTDANWSGRRVTSFFRDDKNNNHQPDQDGTLSGRRATRRLCRGEGSVSRTADTAFAALLERALRRNGAEAREVTLDATNTVSGPLDRTRSMEYNTELLVARAGALASERQQRSGSCAGSAPGRASSVPYSPDSVATGALDLSSASHGNATGRDGHDFFGLGAASSALQSFSTPTRPTAAVVAADPPKGCWGDVEVDVDASASTSRNAKETEERVRSLCSQLLLKKRSDWARDGEELREDDQLKMRQDVIRLLVLLSESPVTLSAGDNDSMPNQEREGRPRQQLQNDLVATEPSFYSIRDVVPMGSLCRPAFDEREIVLWSTMALTGVPSPPYRLDGEKLVQQPFNIHGELDSTSLFGVAQHFADAGTNYLYLAGISDGHSSCEAWSSVIHRVEHHWLDRYRVLADAIKNEVECTSRDATPSVSLLGVSVRARILMSELASLTSIIRRLSRSKPNGSCGIQETLYQLVVMEQLSAIPGNDEFCRTLILQDLFRACLKGTVTKLYRKICFGSLNSLTQAGDVMRLPSFLGDLSDQIGEASKCIDLVQESDRAVFTRLASFHREIGEGDESLPFLCFGFTKEDLEAIIKSQDDRLGRYQALIQGELESKGENSSLSWTTDRNDRELKSSSIESPKSASIESPSDNERHVHSGTFPDLPVSPLWKQSNSTGVWTNESSKKEAMNDSFPSSFAQGGDLANTSKFFALPSELSPTLADSLSLLGDISAKNGNILPIDISMECGIKRFIRKHCEIIEHFSLLFFVRESHLIEHLVLVRRVFVGYGCYLTRLISHCFLPRVNDSNVITGDFLENLNTFCFIASPKEMDLLESVDVNLSLLASDIMSASNGLPYEHSELPAMQVQCPISSIINGAAITKYRDIRAFIVRHLWVEEQRKLTWRRIIQMDRSRTWGNDSEVPRHLYIIRNEIGHLCSALSQYINLSLQCSWQNLLNSLSLNSTNVPGSMKEVCRLHQANLDDLRITFFLVNDDASLTRVKGQMDNLYKIILLILKALVPSEVTGDGLKVASSLSNLWKEYGNGRKALMRSLRIASATHSFSRDLMELLAGDNAGSHN